MLGNSTVCELQATIDGILIIHDWVMVRHNSITSVPETPPVAMPKQVKNTAK